MRTARTNSFGNYRFVGLRSGEVYVVSVASGRYRFDPSARVLTVDQDLANVDFVPASPE